MQDWKLVYSVDYGRIEIESVRLRFDGIPLTREERAEERYLDACEACLEEDEIESPPERVDGKEDFIALAKAISQTFRISTMIWEKPGGARAELTLMKGILPNMLTGLLGRLIAASEMMNLVVGRQAYAVSIILEFTGHR